MNVATCAGDSIQSDQQMLQATVGKLTLTPESLATLGPLGRTTEFWQCAKCNHDFDTEYVSDVAFTVALSFQASHVDDTWMFTST